MLPPYEGKSVMELGAGIGRFTGELAQKAGQLIAMDFIDNVIKKVLFLLELDDLFSLHLKITFDILLSE